MGLLDDAIREHLELKRRRGADPGEIERLEREALGPVRRPGYEANETAVAEEPGSEFGDTGEQPTEYWAGPDDEPDFADHGAEFAREDEDWGPSDIAGAGLDPDAAPPVMPAPRPDEAPPGHGGAYDDELPEDDTAEHNVDGEYGVDPGTAYSDRRDGAYPEPPPDGYPEPGERGHLGPPEQDDPEQSAEEHLHRPEQEDMLEETPEFLQDAPDHDRLWFEQRPPRDFDLDG